MAEAFEYRQAEELAKEAAGRVRDRETLPRLKAFRDWWLQRQKEGS